MSALRTIEELLIDIQQTDDKSSFNELFKRLYPKLNGFAQSFIKFEVVAEEIVLDAFLKLWNKRADLGDIKNIETYLYVTIKNLSLSYLRKEGYRTAQILDEVQVTLTDYTNTPDNILITNDMFTRLNKIVNELPPKCKIIFKLIREDGIERKKAAEILDISPNTIDAQISIAVKKIATGLGIDISRKKDRDKFTLFLLA